MCKGNTNSSIVQAQTDFLELFEVKKKVEMSFSAPELSSLGDLNWKRLSLFGELNLTGYYNNYYLTKSVYLFWFL